MVLAVTLSGCQLASLSPDCPWDANYPSRTCTPTEPDPARAYGRPVVPPVRESER